MTVGVVGSRNWPHPSAVVRFIEKLAKKYPGSVVVSGGARGVDSLAERAAEAEGLEVISYRPYEYVNMHGKPEFSIETVALGSQAEQMVIAKRRRISPPFFPTFARAAFHRNGWIVDDAERIVAFWHKGSSGTNDTLDRAFRAAKDTTIYRQDAA